MHHDTSAIVCEESIDNSVVTRAEGDPAAWPGPKAWPASLILVSFFSVNICFQALLKALDPVVLDNVPPLN